MNKNKIPKWDINIDKEIEKNEKPLDISNVIKDNKTWRKYIYKHRHHNSPGISKWRTNKKWKHILPTTKQRNNYFRKGTGAEESNNLYNGKVFNLELVPTKFSPKTYSEMMNYRKKQKMKSIKKKPLSSFKNGNKTLKLNPKETPIGRIWSSQKRLKTVPKKK